jgi:hypothetical protein
MNVNEIKKQLPDLHSVTEESEELFIKNNLPKDISPHIYHSNVDPNRANYDNYMFRCHALGNITGGIPKPVSQPQIETYKAYKERYKAFGVSDNGTRGKELTTKQENAFHSIGAKLSAKVSLNDAAKKYCEILVNQDVMGYSSSIKSHQLTKGIVRESDSIELYSQYLGVELVKNTERKNNELWSGEWDLIRCKDIVSDIKTSWTRETFTKTALANISSGYLPQGQGYLDLTGRNIFELVYCLVDSLPYQVNNIINKMLYNPDYGTVSGEVEESAIPVIVEEVTNHFVTRKALKEFCDISGVVHYEWFENFYEPPLEKRIKVFSFERDDKLIGQMKELVLLGRDYMNQIIRK